MNAAELILNDDGSIYHLHLRPEDIAPIVILVGDPDRVPLVSAHFDRIDFQKQKREFITHTGWIGAQRFTVISTGIGTDNIDIVLNELDALVNIDLQSRQIRDTLTSLVLIRIGTSGSLHPDIDVDDVVVSTLAVGTDSIGMFYESEKANHPLLPPWAYLTRSYPFSLQSFSLPFKEGITLTCPGFYGPQRRILRISPSYSIPLDGLHTSAIENIPFSNLEMESAAIYLLAEKMGHKPISFNVILANRLAGRFSKDADQPMDALISAVLAWAPSTMHP